MFLYKLLYSAVFEMLLSLPNPDHSYTLSLGLILHMETLKLRVEPARSEEWDLNQGLRFQKNFKQSGTGGQFA